LGKNQELEPKLKKPKQAISRVLSWIVIYLGLLLPRSSSELLLSPRSTAGDFALAPGRVYHSSPFLAGKRGLTPSLFTFTPF